VSSSQEEIAAWVGDHVIPVALIEDRLAVLRSGPYAARLPHPDTAEGRNLRRWLVQVVTTEAVIEHEAAARQITAGPEDGAPRRVTLVEALRAGGVAAAVVAAHPVARALRRHIVPEVRVPDDETCAYHARNRDRYPQPYKEVRARIAAELAAARRECWFARWLDQRHTALVRLAPGFEHPGDPHHPDAVHRH
jgi:[acyl-carrier-protein] S-malonyltransferase